ncbi:hypothetical protein Tco_0361314 [Tanacetum coccineum]
MLSSGIDAEATGLSSSNTETGVPYTEDEIMAIVRGASSGGTFSVLVGFCHDRATVFHPPPPCTHPLEVVKLKKRENVATRQVNMFMKLFRSDDKFSQMLTQLESHLSVGWQLGSGRPGM